MDEHSESAKDKYYKALLEFFKLDAQIKKKIMELVPNGLDEYDQNSRMKYLDNAYSQLEDFKFSIIQILKKFEMSEKCILNFEEFFKKKIQELSKMGYGRPNKGLKEIYQKIFSDMDSNFVETVKSKFYGHYDFNRRIS